MDNSWIITILCVFVMPFVLPQCSYDSSSISLLEGQPLEIFCQDKVNEIKADDLEFISLGKHIKSEKVNSTTRRLFMEKTKRGIFLYYCKNKVTKKVCVTRVIVDTAPTDVTDFNCMSHNLDILNCTWKNPTSYSFTNHSLNLLINGDFKKFCNPSRRGRVAQCIWDTENAPRYKQYIRQFSFQLQSCNKFGCNEQNFTIDHFSIVKPDPANHLKILTVGPHSVLLEWSIPNNMVDLLPNGVDHRIEYQIAKIDNSSYFRKVNTSGLPASNKTYNFLLSDLPYAHMQYEVRIYIRPKEAVEDKFWSDFNYVTFKTDSERPSRSPETVVGAFDQNVYGTKRIIYVYWKQLEEYEEAGVNFTYKVVSLQKTRNSETLIADNRKSLSYIVLQNASLDEINIEISSNNEKGQSLNSSRLFIPPYSDTVSLRVTSFNKLSYENGTYKLSWVGVSNIDNYTLFWCQHDTAKICTGRVNFTILESNKTTHIIDLPRENTYQFAISANNGSKTSGMIWTTCDISKDAIPMHGFPVKLDHGIPGKTFVQISWTMDCTLQESITGYIISYCPVKDNSNVCDTTLEKSTVNITDLKQMAINITDLKPYRTYQFSLALNTSYGLKTIENASTGVTTTEDTPTSPRNVKITDVESSSVVISWNPPQDKNGIIGKYVIYNYSEEFIVDKIPDKYEDSVRRKFKLEGLDGFSNYSWSVAACNSAIRSCSQRSPINGIFVRTRIGAPSKLNLKPPTVKTNELKWDYPAKPGGAVDIYQILKIKNHTEEIFNTTKLSYSFSFCDESGVEKYKVRAVNYEKYDDSQIQESKMKQNASLVHLGEWSDEITIDCTSSSFTVTFIIIAVVAVLFFTAVVGYELVKFFKRRKFLARRCNE